MTYERQFIVGKTYLRRDGKPVKIIAESTTHGPHYTCVQGDDGETRVEEDPIHKGIYELIPGSQLGWRYDRKGDVGRCTGTAPGGPRDLMPGTEQ